jgi:RimJ/RimL family protein N-acetyltransferase
MSGEVTLRDVEEDDLSIFFEQQLDDDANRMAAFTRSDPANREAFMEHWAHVLADDSNGHQTILFDGQVAGNVVSFNRDGEREVGYYLGQAFWGKDIATRALAAYLRIERTRPLYGYTAKDNIGSQRVLQKNGFVPFGEIKAFSNARGEEVEAFVLVFRAPAGDLQ